MNAHFDFENWVWRRHDGRALTADEVEAMGRDAGLRDITAEELADHELLRQQASER